MVPPKLKKTQEGQRGRTGELLTLAWSKQGPWQGWTLSNLFSTFKNYPPCLVSGYSASPSRVHLLAPGGRWAKWRLMTVVVQQYDSSPCKSAHTSHQKMRTCTHLYVLGSPTSTGSVAMFPGASKTCVACCSVFPYKGSRAFTIEMGWM